MWYNEGPDVSRARIDSWAWLAFFYFKEVDLMNKQDYQEKMIHAPWGSLLMHSALLLFLSSGVVTSIWKAFTQTVPWQIYVGFLFFTICLIVDVWMVRQTYRYMMKVNLSKKVFWLKLIQNIGFCILIGILLYVSQFIK